MFESESIRVLAPHLQWRTVTPKGGESVRGWVAGPLVVVTVHYMGKGSKPCRSKLTKGAVKCYCTEMLNAHRQIGYLPIITQGREKLVVLMCATTARKASLLAITEAVEFWRPAKSKVGLSFKHLVPGELGSEEVPKSIKRGPHDIREYLWRVLWQDAELYAHFEKLTDTPAPQCAVPKPDNPQYPTLARKRTARDNAPTVASLTEGIGTNPDAA